ncbi:MAG: sugar phosphate isomerase/epimerase family protein [Cyanobacteria bacterium P01_E01_bin.42]
MSNSEMLPVKSSQFACAAWGWREVEILDYFQWIKSLDIQAVEVNAHPNAPKHLLDRGGEEAIRNIAAWAEESGVDIICVAGRNNFATPEESVLEEQLQKVRGFIDAAKILGAKFVRLLSGEHRNDSPPIEVFPQLQRAFTTVGNYAEERGIKITIENHGGPTATGQRIARIMEGVQSAAVGLNYDPANFLNQGTDPLMALRYILPWVNYSHWKDVRWVDNAPQFCAFGEGEINWLPIIQELRNSGYQGYWAVEYENPEDVERGTKVSLQNLQAMLKNS